MKDADLEPSRPISVDRRITSAQATALVFITSAAVLVLEILAGRLLAPYVGISLETFTGIIGTMLAGIAAGAWAGGALADTRDPAPLIGPTIALGGALSWLSLPIVDGLGPELGAGPGSIIVLTAAAFFAPAAVLTAASPMIAKLRLHSLDETGAVVGGLSASGTLGALAGTFLTGFVLVAAAPVRPLVIGIGAAMVVLGFATSWMLARARPGAGVVVVVIAAGLTTGASSSPCQYETRYACVVVAADPDNPSLRSLYLDGVRNAAVDLDDPEVLDIRYIRLFADVADTLPPGPLRTLHVGGGGFGFPRYLQATRPGSADLVFEIDGDLVDIAEDELGLVRSDRLLVETIDARVGIGDVADGSMDLVVGDAFSGLTVPWHLTTREFVREIDRVLVADGIYVMNVIDSGDHAFARAQLATLAAVFDHVMMIAPPGGVDTQASSNWVLLASPVPLPEPAVDPDDGIVLDAAETRAFAGSAAVLRDDFAPVDQLRS